MKTRIIFWAVPVILATIIVVILYQISLEEDNTLSLVLEQELAEVAPESAAFSSQETSSEEEQSSDQMQKPVLAEETPSNEPIAVVETTEEPPQPLPEKEEEPRQKEKSTFSFKEVAAKTTQGISKQKKGGTASAVSLEKAALVETPDTPWMIVSAKQKGTKAQWQTILVRNECKLDYTILPQDAGMWKIVKAGKQLRVHLMTEQEGRKDILSRKKKGKYAVQILSVERKYFNRAMQTVQELVRDGYYAYLHRTKEKFENKYWYRVRIGFFKTVQEAQAMGEEVYFRYRDVKDLPQNYWAVLPSPQELDRELVDFQAQRNKPWVLELPEYDSKEKALADLPELIEISDFAYLAYKQVDQKIHYRTRLGFFETQAEATKLLEQLRKIRATLSATKLLKL